MTVYDHDELERLRSLVKDMHAPHRKRFGQKIVDAVRKKFRPPPKPPVSVKNKEAEKKIPKRDVG